MKRGITFILLVIFVAFNSKCVSAKISAGTKASLTDLNDDVLLMIMGELDLEDFQDLALINHHFAKLASKAFRRKLYNTTVGLHSESLYIKNFNDFMNSSEYAPESDFDFWNNTMQPSSGSILWSRNSIRLLSPAPVWNLLKYNVNAIRKLIFKIYTENPFNYDFMAFLNDRCSESLVELELWFTPNDEISVLNYLMQPFKAVERLSFHYFYDLSNGILSMDQLFPRLRELHLFNFASETNNDFIRCRLPNLEVLKIGWHRQLLHHNLAAESELIQLNPQVKHIDLERPTAAILQVVAENSTDLESLSLSYYDLSTNIRFSSVTKFEMKHHFRYPDNLRFDNLQELRVTCKYGRYERWGHFLSNNTQLRRLHFEKFADVDALLPIYTKHLRNMEEMSISIADGQSIRPDTLIQYLTGAEKLTKFVLEKRFEKEDEAILEAALGQKWTITKVNFGLIFDRIQAF